MNNKTLLKITSLALASAVLVGGAGYGTYSVIQNVWQSKAFAESPYTWESLKTADTAKLTAAGLSNPWNVGVDKTKLDKETLYQIPSGIKHVVKAADYGVKANDKYDDTKALNQAIDAAKAFNGELTQIVLPSGSLDFIEGMNDKNHKVGVYLEDMKNIVLSGSNTTLYFHGTFQGMEMNRCENVLVTGIKLDWGRPPFSMAEILSSDGKVFEVKVKNGYPVDENTVVAAFLEYNPDTLVPRVNGNDIYGDIQSVTYLGSQKLRIEFKTQHAVPPEGTLAVIRHNTYGYDGITVRSCKGMKFENVTVYTAPGMGLMAYSSNDLYFNRFNVKLREDSDRLMSSTADGMHLMDCAGELTVTNSIFENCGDDALNAHGAYLKISSKTSANKVYAFNTRGYNFKPNVGDVLEFSRISTLMPVFSAKVTAVTDSATGSGFDITFDQAIPDTIVVGDVISNATRTPQLVFKNNLVRNKRCRGVLIQTRNALVENNTFANLGNGAVLITTDAGDWYESLGSHNVIIRNNKMVGNNFAQGRTEGDISMIALAANNIYGPAGVFKNITIENNFIANTGNAGIFANSVDGLTIKHNLVTSSGLDAKGEYYNAGIGISYSKNITMEKNRIVPNNSGKFKGLSVGAALDVKTVKLTANDGIDSSSLDLGTASVSEVKKITGNAINVTDGSLSDWTNLGSAIAINGISDADQNEVTPSASDFKVNSIKMAWDDNNVYFCYDVTDDELVWISGQYWLGDGVEVFATNDLTSDDPMEVIKYTNDSCIHIFMSGKNSGGSFVADTRSSASVYAAKSNFKLNLWEKADGKGYYGEAAIPLSAVPGIKQAIASGKEVKFTLRFADSDTSGGLQIQASNALHPVEFNKFVPSRMPAVKFVP